MSQSFRTPLTVAVSAHIAVWSVLLLPALPGGRIAAADGAKPASKLPTELLFERDIYPIFRAHCLDCHGATADVSGKLDLRQVRRIMAGGESGPALVPGDAVNSPLLGRIRAGEMPPGQTKVPAAELARLEAWVAQGARTIRPEPETIPSGLGITEEERGYWFYAPLLRPPVPRVKRQNFVATPIDSFILQKLEEKGLTYTPKADRPTLIRRAYFDLIGLPPTPQQIDRFVKDDSSAAWDHVIDELLQSPHYGERWARHWLDVAGYADSDGCTSEDPVRPNAYRYRDYVIKSFNSDKSFNQFVVEQLAGDELVKRPYNNLTGEDVELLAATGFLRTAADGTTTGTGDQNVAANQVVGDTIKIVSSSLLGLSVGCAQCHDHRYDPIPQADYFALRAVFEPALDYQHWRRPAERNISLWTDEDRKRAAKVDAEAKVVEAERQTKQDQFVAEALEIELLRHPAELRDGLRTAYKTVAKDRTPEQTKLLAEHPSVNINPVLLHQYSKEAAQTLKDYDQKIATIRAQMASEGFVAALTEVPGSVPETKLFFRGDYREPREAIAPGDLQIAAPPGERFNIPLHDPLLPTSGRRLAWARHITANNHPLVPRVLVNRFWMLHFGRGIVATPGEFGKLGELPSHPELLDWLASDFVSQGWSLKKFHRQLMRSTVYQQGTQHNPKHDAIDSDNRLLARMPVRRLEAEVIRDRMLAASDILDRTVYGPSIPVKADDTGQIIVEGDSPRRSLYVQARRTEPLAFLSTFDAPVMDINCDRRPSSTVASQALLLMNNEFVLKQARGLAERALRDAPEIAQTGAPRFFMDRLGRKPPVWSYGYGAYRDKASRVENFKLFPAFVDGVYRGVKTLPDPVLSYCSLTAKGGHTGNNHDFIPIRRWTAPKAGVITVTGKLTHLPPAGDGVQALVVQRGRGNVADWIATHNSVETKSKPIRVSQGDTLDFLVDCRANPNSDSFEWTFQLSSTTGGSWDSNADFAAPPVADLDRQIVAIYRLALGRPPVSDEWPILLEFAIGQLKTLDAEPPGGSASPEMQMLTNLAQQLISSNEFLYAD